MIIWLTSLITVQLNSICIESNFENYKRIILLFDWFSSLSKRDHTLPKLCYRMLFGDYDCWLHNTYLYLCDINDHNNNVSFCLIADALLADLQNTVSPEGNHAGNNATPGYGSLNGARSNPGAYRGYDNRTSPLPPQSVRNSLINNTTLTQCFFFLTKYLMLPRDCYA